MGVEQLHSLRVLSRAIPSHDEYIFYNIHIHIRLEFKTAHNDVSSVTGIARRARFQERLYLEWCA